MKRRLKTALGIDISESRISIAVMGKDEQGVRLLQGYSAALPEGAVIAGKIHDTQAFAQVLHSLRGQFKTKCMPATLSLFGTVGITQILELPRRIPGNIGDYVQSELKQYVAMARDTLVSDYCGITATREGHHRLLAVAADERRVAEVIGLCRAAQLNIQVVEPPMIGTMRALYATRVAEHPDRNTMIIALRNAWLQISVFKNGSLDFIRSRDIREVKQVPEALYHRVASEIDATIQYYGIEVLDDADVWQISVLAQESLNLPADTAKRLQRGHPQAEVEILTTESIVPRLPEAAGACGAQEASPVAVGLAMRLLTDNDNIPHINLLPFRIARLRSLCKQALWTGMAAAVIVVVMGLVIAGMTWHADRTRLRIAASRTTHDVNDTVALVDQRDWLDQHLDQMTKSHNLIHNQLKGHRIVNWAELLADIGDMGNPGLDITRLDNPRDEQSLLIDGRSLTFGAIKAFVRTLGQSVHIADAQLTKTEQKTIGPHLVVAYQIKCELVSQPGL
ncbi:pilus assembly protein PilM [Planctomycetota bacterium]